MTEYNTSQLRKKLKEAEKKIKELEDALEGAKYLLLKGVGDINTGLSKG